MPLVKPDSTAKPSTWLWEDVEKNKFFVLQKYKIGWNGSFRIILLVPSIYLVAEAFTAQEIESDWNHLQSELKRQRTLYDQQTQRPPNSSPNPDHGLTPDEIIFLGSALLRHLMATITTPPPSKRKSVPTEITIQRVDSMPVLPKPDDSSPPIQPPSESSPLRSRSKSFDSPSRIRKTDEQPALDSLQPLRDKAVVDLIKERKVLKTRTTIEIKKKREEDMSELAKWEAQKLEYIKSIVPILKSNQEAFENLCEKYVNDLKAKIQLEFPMDEHLQLELVQRESTRVNAMIAKVFDLPNNSSLKLIEEQIVLKKQAFEMRKKVIKVQSIARGWLTRKKHSKKLKRERSRNKCAWEILETERSYCSNLGVMIGPLLGAHSIISHEDVAIIFSNSESIFNVNTTLLEELEVKMRNWSSTQTLGDLFLKMLYTSYVNNYDKALSTFNRVNKKQEFGAFLKQSLPAEQKLDLASLLIMPIQRIPRYELLLKELVKLTPEDHPDYESLIKAYSVLGEVAKTINESKRKVDNMNKLMQIQEALDLKNLVEPHRVFVKEGPVVRERVGNSVDNTCYIYLLNDLLLITQRKKSLLDTFYFTYKETIDLASIMTIYPLDDAKGNKIGFALALPGKREEKFYIDSDSENKKWMDAFLNQLSHVTKTRKSLKVSSEASLSQKVLSPGPTTTQPESSERPMSGSRERDGLMLLNKIHSLRGSSSGKLKKLIDFLKEAAQLEQDIFQAPIDIKTLLPEYYNSEAGTEFKERIHKLAKKLDEIENVHSDLKVLLQREGTLLVVDRLLSDGSKPISDLKTWVAKHYLSNDSIADSERESVWEQVTELLAWYANLLEAWKTLTEKDL